tara:strand:+ start:261 stop:1790 length:1530 start_codon:yes stop_codon:yes gene_type:complete
MKKDLDSLLSEHYKRGKSNKIGPNVFLEMIEEVMGEILSGNKRISDIKTLMEQIEERVIRFPKIKITEKWGEKHNEDREIFETMMRNVYGSTVQEKLANVAEFLNHKEGLSVAEILSNLMFVEIFSNILEEFNPSTAGFLFEAFLAGLFKGVQISDPEGGSLPITDVELFVQRGFGETEEIVDYSLKVLSPNTDLKGSFVNLVDFFRNPEKKNDSVTYLAVTKEGGTGPVGRLLFYEFTIDKTNFFDWIGHETIEAEKTLDTIEFTPSVDGVIEGNKLKLGGLQIGGSPRVGKMTEEGFVFVTSKSNRSTKDAYEEIPTEEITVFYPVSYALKDPLTTGKKSDYGLGMSLGGQRLSQGDTILLDQTYEITVDTGERSFIRTGEKSTGHGKLYGDVIADWDILMNNPEAIPGYAQNKQWHISPRYYREMGNQIGELDLSKDRLHRVFEAYASNLGESLVNLYNSLADLSININKYFLDSDKTAGMAAIQNATAIKTESENLIKTEEPTPK